MVEAYDHVSENAPKPYELVLLGYIDRFGAEAVMGRPVLSAGELRRMIMAENICNAFTSRKASENWAQWVRDNPVYSGILAKIEKLKNANSN